MCVRGQIKPPYCSPTYLPLFFIYHIARIASLVSLSIFKSFQKCREYKLKKIPLQFFFFFLVTHWNRSRTYLQNITKLNVSLLLNTSGVYKYTGENKTLFNIVKIKLKNLISNWSTNMFLKMGVNSENAIPVKVFPGIYLFHLLPLFSTWLHLFNPYKKPNSENDMLWFYRGLCAELFLVREQWLP